MSITLPTQDMVLGLYYISNERSTEEEEVGRGLTFYNTDDAKIAWNEGKVDLHAVKMPILNHETNKKVIETTVGRILFNDCTEGTIH